MIGDMCVCGRYDCPEWEAHTEQVRLELDVQPDVCCPDHGHRCDPLKDGPCCPACPDRPADLRDP